MRRQIDMDNSEIRKKLNSVNWNFDFDIKYNEDLLHPFNCRDYYSYPATFIPEIPYALIEILSKKGDVVLDPFGGIGTTFMQALILEREPYTFDINPIATNVCTTLYDLFNPAIDKQQLQTNLLQICDEYKDMVNYTKDLSGKRRELLEWFEPSTLNEVAFLVSKYDQENNPVLRNTLGLVLSSTLVTLSSQNKGWAYIADNVKPKTDELKRKSVFYHYKMTVKKLIFDIENYLKISKNSFSAFYTSLRKENRVFTDSIINSELEEGSVDLVITSPPYPRMIDYVKSQRLSFYFFEEDFKDYSSKEIGARCHRSRKTALDDYEKAIQDINKIIVSKLKKNGYLCIVLPDYDSADNRKETIDKIVRNYRDLGLEKVFETSRYIPSNKRTLSIQWAKLVNERIYVFQKG